MSGFISIQTRVLFCPYRYTDIGIVFLCNDSYALLYLTTWGRRVTAYSAEASRLVRFICFK